MVDILVNLLLTLLAHYQLLLNTCGAVSGTN